jgi:hypothetical protein
MGHLTIYGASDDLIEIEGDIDGEFYAIYGSDNDTYLAFSDGSLLSISYTSDGLWKISILSIGEATTYKIDLATDIDENYSDRVTLYGDFEWIVQGTDLVRVAK